MSSIITLLLWLTIISLAAWRPGLYRRFGKAVVLLSALLALGLSEFWQSVLRAPWIGDRPSLAGPEAAFVSVWILVLAPLLQQCLDRSMVMASLHTGLLAAAAVGVAIDIGHLVLSRLLFAAASLSAIATMLVVAIALLLAGFALRLLAAGDRFPWDYAPWSAGLLIMVQPAHPAFLELAPGAHHGLWTVTLAFTTCACLWLGLHSRGRHALLWIGSAFLTPLIAGFVATR